MEFNFGSYMLHKFSLHEGQIELTYFALISSLDKTLAYTLKKNTEPIKCSKTSVGIFFEKTYSFMLLKICIITLSNRNSFR